MMIERARRLLLPAVSILLLACWLGGGVTVDDTGLDEALQLMALPVLLLAAWLLLADGASRWVQAGIAVALLIVLVPLVQLLPVPAGLWHWPLARQALVADLMAAGVQVNLHWSLTPAATERGLWALLPAMASFLAACALEPRQRRTLLQVVLVLVLFNVAFAFFQAGLPQDSALRLYQDFSNGFGGLLVNTNHQATACIIGMVLALGLAAEARLREARGEARPRHHWRYLGLAVFLLAMVPLATSRAGMVIVLPAFAVALLLTGLLRPRRILRSRRMAAITLLVFVLAAVGIRAGIGWMGVDQVDEMRHEMATAALAIGRAEAPLGSGVGSFVPAFEQSAPLSLRLPNYINHAHNEFAQWWMTSGWLGMLALAAVVGLLLVVGWRVLRSEGRQAALAAACWVALVGVLAHSWVDYPLRTLTLMATCGALAGVMLAAVGDAHARQRGRSQAVAPVAADAGTAADA